MRTRQLAENDARNSRARNDAILEVALDSVILMDEAGQIVQFNPAAERTFGYGAAEAVGRTGRTGSFPTTGAPVRQASYLQTGRTAILNRRLELTALRKGGERFPVEGAIAPISSDGAAMFAGYMRDITERADRAKPRWRVTRESSKRPHTTQRKTSEQLAALVERAGAGARPERSRRRHASRASFSLS